MGKTYSNHNIDVYTLINTNTTGFSYTMISTQSQQVPKPRLRRVRRIHSIFTVFPLALVTDWPGAAWQIWTDLGQMLLCSDALYLSKEKAWGGNKNKNKDFTCSQRRELILFVDIPLELLYLSTPKRVTFNRAHSHLALGMNLSHTHHRHPRSAWRTEIG